MNSNNRNLFIRCPTCEANIPADLYELHLEGHFREIIAALNGNNSTSNHTFHNGTM